MCDNLEAGEAVCVLEGAVLDLSLSEEAVGVLVIDGDLVTSELAAPDLSDLSLTELLAVGFISWCVFSLALLCFGVEAGITWSLSSWNCFSLT